MDNRSSSLHRFMSAWRRDTSLSILLGLLAFLIFVMEPLRATGLVKAIVLDVGFGMFAIAGVLVMTERPRTARTGAVLALVAILIRALQWQMPSPGMHLAQGAVMEVFLVVLAWAVLHQVLAPGLVTGHHIKGAVVVYLLLALIWAQSYDLIEELFPGSFNPSGMPHRVEWTTFLYFSLVTLTTVGYGDVTATAPFARSVATAEAIIGQLFPAILIARLVSQELESRGTRK